jgi:uncharacterized protein
VMSENNRPAVMGFHDGELAVQQRADVQAEAARLSGMLDPVGLRRGNVAFLTERSFAVIAARDGADRLWISPLTGQPGFLAARSPTTLSVHTALPDGDPLHRLPPGQSVGFIVIEFAARRRLRINGILSCASDHQLVIDVEQAYGNCPQYIQQRLVVPESRGVAGLRDIRLGADLGQDDVDLIRSADTFFLGTTHPARGKDASHRGGPAGFVRVDGNQLWWPDYPGNNMFNSFGNLEIDPTAALLFLDFDTGRTVHLSGTAAIEWGPNDTPGDDGHTGRRARFTIERVVSGRLLAARQTVHTPYAHNPAITD